MKLKKAGGNVRGKPHFHTGAPVGGGGSVGGVRLGLPSNVGTGLNVPGATPKGGARRGHEAGGIQAPSGVSFGNFKSGGAKTAAIASGGRAFHSKRISNGESRGHYGDEEGISLNEHFDSLGKRLDQEMALATRDYDVEMHAASDHHKEMRSLQNEHVGHANSIGPVVSQVLEGHRGLDQQAAKLSLDYMGHHAKARKASLAQRIVERHRGL